MQIQSGNAVTEGEIPHKKEKACKCYCALSLPQSNSLTAPSSEGALLCKSAKRSLCLQHAEGGELLAQRRLQVIADFGQRQAHLAP